MPKLYALVILSLAVRISSPSASAAGEGLAKASAFLAYRGGVHSAPSDDSAARGIVHCPNFERLGKPRQIVHVDPFGLHPRFGAAPSVARTDSSDGNEHAAVIPEPTTMALLLLGIGGVLAHRRIVL